MSNGGAFPGLCVTVSLPRGQGFWILAIPIGRQFIFYILYLYLIVVCIFISLMENYVEHVFIGLFVIQRSFFFLPV